MEDCIFCKIIKGEIPCYKIYEDEDVIATLDISPLSKGHILVLPKSHYENIFSIPEDILCKVSKIVKKMSQNLKDKYAPEGILINQNNGLKAGQSIFHYHVHIKPIYNDTHSVFDDTVPRNKFSKEVMEEIVKELRMD